MKLLPTVAQPAWRRTGFINLLFIFVCVVILLVSFAVGFSKSRVLNHGHVIFKGDCQNARRLNLILHLLINLLSTVVAASSSFFMRILNSPSRKEIDQAHQKLRSLQIGVSSIQNLDFVSSSKRFLWFSLVFITLPIHLFLNSTVFATEYLGAYYNITIAAEPFLRGANYSLPGASLVNPSNFSDLCTLYGGSRGCISTTESDAIRRRLDTTAESANSWDRINPQQCRVEYKTYTAKQKYRNVVIIVDPGSNDGMGWTEVDDSYHNPAPSVVNALWFSAECMNYKYTSSFQQVLNRNTCSYFLGLQNSWIGPPKTQRSN